MSFTEVSEALDDCAQGVLAECGAARCGNTFLDLEKSCCFSCRFGQGPRWPMLTLVVSLQGIFLSASVMIGQNRQSNFQQGLSGMIRRVWIGRQRFGDRRGLRRCWMA